MYLRFETPTDSIMPTVDVAVELTASRLKSFVVGPEGEDQFIRNLRMFHVLITTNLWEGSLHLASITNREDINKLLDEISDIWIEEWDCLVKAIVADAASHGISKERFLYPMSFLDEPLRGWSYAPHAQQSMSRLLGCQFHLDDAPSVFLIRQVALRILFKAYAVNFSAEVKSEFIQCLRSMSLSHEWSNVPELNFAAVFYAEKWGVQSRVFRDLIYAEVCLMADIFELMLRQLQDPVPI